MSSYTIEDIELIRQKSGISYQEAVALLDYHNGNVARALVDLERNGRIKPENARANGKAEGKTSRPAGKKKNGFFDFISSLYRARVKVSKGETSILNLSLLFSIVVAIASPHILILGVILMLVLGYRFSFTRNDPAFEADNLERMVRSAAENVKSSVGDFARGVQDGFSDSKGEAKEGKKSSEADESKAEERSYYQNRSNVNYHPEVPTINVPVQVESRDGSVTVENEGNGYNSATIQ